MTAAATSYKYPDFDRIEIVSEPDLNFRKYDRVVPVKAGDTIPDFTFEKDNSRWQQFFNGVATEGPVLLRQLLHKPLIISFYSGHWQSHGVDVLKHLNAIQLYLRKHDANLLVVSSEKDRRLDKIAWDNSLSLRFYFDNDKQIAEKFGVYSESDPLWNRVSGIDTNVPLLATYVVSAQGKITYTHIDLSLSEPFPAKEIITALGERTFIP